MKYSAAVALGLLACSAAAHSAVTSIVFDGVRYPARNAQYDKALGAQRIEWNFDDVNGFPWFAVTDVLDPAIACGLNAQPPELAAVARAGSNVTVQWSGIIRMHMGPVMTYLGEYQPGMTAQQVDFFKINDDGYNNAKSLWANEKLIQHDTADTFQLPSNLKAGRYILRTELLALHGNSINTEPVRGGGPQFYTHCFNVDITGEGNATIDASQTVRFPGAYKRHDSGVDFNLEKGPWDKYVIPGPAKWVGAEYLNPVGVPANVSARATGAFPEPIEAKYQKYKIASDKWANSAHAFFNDRVDNWRPTPEGDKTSAAGGTFGFMRFMTSHYYELRELRKVQSELKADLKKEGYKVLESGWIL